MVAKGWKISSGNFPWEVTLGNFENFAQFQYKMLAYKSEYSFGGKNTNSLHISVNSHIFLLIPVHSQGKFPPLNIPKFGKPSYQINYFQCVLSPLKTFHKVTEHEIKQNYNFPRHHSKCSTFAVLVDFLPTCAKGQVWRKP